MTDMDITPLYRLTDIRHGYNSRFMLDIPQLTILRGTSLGFSGPNGGGKSTLFRILAFLEKPCEGTIKYDGHETPGVNQIRSEITMLLQEPYLLKRSVFENVAYGLRLRGERKDVRERVHESLMRVGLNPEKFSRRHWFELSGGEAKRVALASRLILRPRVLILDEPISNIDSQSKNYIKEAITEIRKLYNTTLIISSHDHIWLNRIADEILKIYDGRLVGSGIENSIEGPWLQGNDNLWSKALGDGRKIFSTKPPDSDAIALLDPAEIIISNVMQSRLSAQNLLKGEILNMTRSDELGKVKVEVEVSGLSFICNVTQHAVNDLQLLPGREVWLIFKASSLHWQ